MEKERCDIGLIGLAVMGQNLVLNMNDHGYRVAVFNRTVSKVDDFIHKEAAGTQVVGTHSIQELVRVLKKPRRVMLSGVESLTPSEVRVARLAAGGMSNREIAQELFVSVKTVETHLGSAYRKLDISSRQELPSVLSE